MSKISELSDGGVVQGGDTLIAVRSGGNVKVTYGGSTTANIDGGTIDGTVIGGTTPAAVTTTALVATTADINAGTIDGTVIGGSTAAAGSFTTLAASGAVTLSGGTANGVAFLNGSKVLTTGSALTFNGTTLIAPAGGLQLGSFAYFSGGVTSNLVAGTNAAVGFEVRTNAAIRYQINSDGTSIWSTGGGTERMRLTSTGNVGIGTSSPATELDVSGAIRASTGILFGSDTAAANTLDDYEEGTFTPVLTGSTSGTFNGSGKYTRIGNTVHVALTFASITTANKPIGNYTITGLPFFLVATTPDSQGFYLSFARVTFDSSKIISASANASTTVIVLSEPVSNDVATAVTDANFVNGSNMFFRVYGTYFTN